MRRLTTVGLVLIVAAQIAGQAQRESGQGAVSSSVVGWWMAHQADAGTSTLDLLILWRGGTPGWLFRADGTGGSASGHQGFGSNTGTQTMWAGDRALTWTFDLAEKTITILDQSFSLAEVNVVLVDDADSLQGSRVVRALRIDPTYQGDAPHFELALRRSPELLEFLQCDAELSDPRQQALTALICARLTGR